MSWSHCLRYKKILPNSSSAYRTSKILLKPFVPTLLTKRVVTSITLNHLGLNLANRTSLFCTFQRLHCLPHKYSSLVIVPELLFSLNKLFYIGLLLFPHLVFGLLFRFHGWNKLFKCCSATSIFLLLYFWVNLTYRASYCFGGQDYLRPNNNST